MALTGKIVGLKRADSEEVKRSGKRHKVEPLLGDVESSAHWQETAVGTCEAGVCCKEADVEEHLPPLREPTAGQADQLENDKECPVEPTGVESKSPVQLASKAECPQEFCGQGEERSEKELVRKEQKDHLMHVLAVDDSPVDRRLVERLLRNVPYKVTTAESGVHALGVLGLDRFKAESSTAGGVSEKVPPDFDLIMTDYSMPGLTGYQLLQRLKQEETGLEDVPVVIMSSDNFPNRVAKCMQGGAEEYLHKPVQAADITRINAHILARKENGGAKSPSPVRESG